MNQAIRHTLFTCWIIIDVACIAFAILGGLAQCWWMVALALPGVLMYYMTPVITKKLKIDDNE